MWNKKITNGTLGGTEGAIFYFDELFMSITEQIKSPLKWKFRLHVRTHLTFLLSGHISPVTERY